MSRQSVKIAATRKFQAMSARDGDPNKTLCGRVEGIAVDSCHHFSKTPVDSIRLIRGHGVEGDAHAGPYVRHRYLARRQPKRANLRQVHLIPSELFAALREDGYDLAAGDLGDNIATSGLSLEMLPLNTTLQIGDAAVVTLTGLRTPCALIDRFREGLKRRILDLGHGPRFRCGILGIVTASGVVQRGDRVVAILPSKRLALPAL
jgi:hypothetical protein